MKDIFGFSFLFIGVNVIYYIACRLRYVRILPISLVAWIYKWGVVSSNIILFREIFLGDFAFGKKQYWTIYFIVEFIILVFLTKAARNNAAYKMYREAEEIGKAIGRREILRNKKFNKEKY